MSSRSTLRRRAAVPLAVVLAVSSVPLLTGCFGNPVEGAIKAATGGKVNVGGGSLPSDFPSSVPVYKGKIDSALGLGSGSKEVWNVTVELPKDAFADIKSELAGAGMKIEEAGTDSKSGGTVIAKGDRYGALVVITEDDNTKKWLANYTVTSADSSN